MTKSLSGEGAIEIGAGSLGLTASQSQTVSLDDIPLNRFHIKIAGLTFGAHFTEGYALGTIGYALSAMGNQLPINDFWTGMIGSSALIGIFLGSLLFGRLSDVMGRQKIFLCSFLIITVASFAQFFVTSAAMLCALRIIIGIGMGGDFAVGHAILAEFSPRKHRGVLLGSFSVIWTIGYVVANLLGLYYSSSTPDAWRWLLASASIPAFAVLILRMGTPESPRWLLRHGRKEQADAIVHKYFGSNVTLEDDSGGHGGEKQGFARLFKRDLLSRTFFNCTFFTCLVMPYFAIYTYLPIISKIMHLDDKSNTPDFLLNGFLVLGALIGIWLTIKLSRRGFLISSFAITCIALAAMALLPPNASIALLVAFGTFTLVLSAFSNLVGVYPPECFPTNVRASGVGLSIACSRLGAAASTFLLPLSMSGLGFQPTMLILSGVLLVGMVVSIMFAPETKHLTLSQCGSAAAK